MRSFFFSIKFIYFCMFKLLGLLIKFHSMRSRWLCTQLCYYNFTKSAWKIAGCEPVLSVINAFSNASKTYTFADCQSKFVRNETLNGEKDNKLLLLSAEDGDQIKFMFMQNKKSVDYTQCAFAAHSKKCERKIYWAKMIPKWEKEILKWLN